MLMIVGRILSPPPCVIFIGIIWGYRGESVTCRVSFEQLLPSRVAGVGYFEKIFSADIELHMST